jgi:hypothetical protein
MLSLSLFDVCLSLSDVYMLLVEIFYSWLLWSEIHVAMP